MPKITKPDVNNLNPKYWEKVLESHGLGVSQPLTDNSDEPGASQTSEPTGKITQLSAKHAGDDSSFLRQIVDGSDPFMSQASTMKIKTIDREIPEWAFNDARVQEVLLRSFRKLDTNENQRVKAGRWLRIIYLYYRMRLPHQVVAKELRISVESLKYFIRCISWSAAGLSKNGKPRKKLLTPPTPLEGTRRKGNGEKIKGSHLLVSADGSGRKKATKSR